MKWNLRWDYNMLKLIYAPKALEDLQRVKAYVTKQFGEDKAKNGVKEITSTVRQLETFPDEGPSLEDFLQILFEISSVSEEGEDYWTFGRYKP